MPDLLIGTSGYDYPEWKGVFYHEDLKRKDFLSYQATEMDDEDAMDEIRGESGDEVW